MARAELVEAVDATGIELLTINDLMEITGIKRTAAYALVRSKGFPSVYIGGSVRIPKLLFVAWLLDSCPYKPQCEFDVSRIKQLRGMTNA